MASPLLAGIPISSRFAEKLGIAQEKQDQQQMTHTKVSTQDDKSWDATLYEKSDIYRSIKDAYTAPMRAWKGEIDPYSNEGVMEAINLAGVGLTGSIPGGAKGPGSLGTTTLYHGGRAFTKWDPKTIGSGEGYLLPQGPGLYAGDMEDLARIYMKYGGDDPALLKLDVDDSRIFNPSKKMTDQHREAFAEAARRLGTTPLNLRNRLSDLPSYKREEVRKLLVESGIDGFRQTLPELGDEWVIFNPEAIKSIERKAMDGLNSIGSPIEDLEASVKEQVKQLDSTGWDRLPGAAGKRDSDVQPTFLQKMYKEHPNLVKSKPSELEKLEIKLRRIYKLPEEEIEDIMLPLWSTYLRNQKSDDPAEEHTQRTKMKRWM